MTTNIWQSYMWNTDSNEHYLSISENKTWKNAGLNMMWTHDLCDTGAVLYQLS